MIDNNDKALLLILNLTLFVSIHSNYPYFRKVQKKNFGIVAILPNVILGILAAVIQLLFNLLLYNTLPYKAALHTALLFIVGYMILRFKERLFSFDGFAVGAITLALLFFACCLQEDFSFVGIVFLGLTAAFYYLLRIEKKIIPPRTFLFAFLKVALVALAWVVGTLFIFTYAAPNFSVFLFACYIFLAVFMFMLPVEYRHREADHSFGISNISDFFSKPRLLLFSQLINILQVAIGLILSQSIAVSSLPFIVVFFFNAAAFYFFIQKNISVAIIDDFLLVEFLLLYIAYYYLLL